MKIYNCDGCCQRAGSSLVGDGTKTGVQEASPREMITKQDLREGKSSSGGLVGATAQGRIAWEETVPNRPRPREGLV